MSLNKKKNGRGKRERREPVEELSSGFKWRTRKLDEGKSWREREGKRDKTKARKGEEEDHEPGKGSN